MNKKILIVEDEPSVLRAVSRRLEKEGFSVSTASDGAQAMELLDSNSFDLVIIDLVLPKKNGLQVLNYAKQELKLQVPVFIMSNSDEREEANKTKRLGAEKYFVKVNMELSDLVNSVKQRLSSD